MHESQQTADVGLEHHWKWVWEMVQCLRAGLLASQLWWSVTKTSAYMQSSPPGTITRLLRFSSLNSAALLPPQHPPIWKLCSLCPSLTDWRVHKSGASFIWSAECFPRFSQCSVTLGEHDQSNQSGCQWKYLRKHRTSDNILPVRAYLLQSWSSSIFIYIISMFIIMEIPSALCPPYSSREFFGLYGSQLGKKQHSSKQTTHLIKRKTRKKKHFFKGQGSYSVTSLGFFFKCNISLYSSNVQLFFWSPWFLIESLWVSDKSVACHVDKFTVFF